MNWKRGFRRLAVSLSFLSFPIAGLISISVLQDSYYIYSPSLVDSLMKYLVFILGWGILSSIAVWVMCRLALFVIEGFQGVRVEQESNIQGNINTKRKLKKNPLLIYKWFVLGFCENPDFKQKQ